MSEKDPTPPPKVDKLSIAIAAGQETNPPGHAQDKEIDIDSVPEMSLEDIDGYLLKEVPEFINLVKRIGADKSLSILHVSVEDETANLKAEINSWRSKKGWRSHVYAVAPFTPWLILKIKIWRFKIIAAMVGFWIRFKHLSYFLATTGRRNAIAKLKLQIELLQKQAETTLKVFKKLSLKLKLVFFVTILLVVLSVAVAYRSLTKGLMPIDKETFLSSFENHSSQTFEYESSEVEPYLDNPRASQNLVLTQKMFVNLRPEPPEKGSTQDPENQTANPMGAFEFFIEGMSSDVAIEVKDREPMMRDLMQRVISEMTFAELDTEAGKKDLCARLQKEITRVLSTGSVKNVRIKTIIIKP